MIVGVPLDVGVVVAVHEIYVHVDVPDDAGEPQFADRIAQHALPEFPKGEIGRLPPEPQFRARVSMACRTRGSHSLTMLTTRKCRAINPAMSTMVLSPNSGRLPGTEGVVPPEADGEGK